jgi:hypothetical protein
MKKAATLLPEGRGLFFCPNEALIRWSWGPYLPVTTGARPEPASVLR